MRKVIIALLIVSLCGIGYAANKQVKITLNDDQQDAWENMLNTDEAGLEAALQDYVVAVAENHITQRLQEELDNMTKEEVRAAIPNFKVKKNK